MCEKGFIMSLLMAVFTFLNVWWITLFATLPMCIERGTTDSSLDYQAAPKKIHWRRIVKINTLIAFVATLLLALTIESGIVPVK